MSSRRIAAIAALVACFGLIDSTYLTIKHLQGAYIRCGGDCSAVLGSRYADGIAGVPMSAFGAIAYLTVLISAVFAARGSTIGRRVLGLMAMLMALVSVWLIYLQAFVIHAFCKFCLASAAASFALAGLVVVERFVGRKRSG